MPNYNRGDFDQVSFKHEAPSFLTTSGAAIWPNQVQAFSIDETEGTIVTRYAGGGDRNVDQFNKGPIDFRFTLPFNVQNGQVLWQAFGKETISSGTTSTHTIVETSGTLPSETFEIFKGAGQANLNHVRTVAGCTANQLTLKSAMGQLVTAEVEWIGASGTWLATSGAAASVTEATTVPYRWDNTQLVISGAGTFGTVLEVKEFEFNLNNNVDDDTHYLNNQGRNRGQVVPQGRDYTFDWTVNGTAGSLTNWYNQFFRGGSTANFDLFLFRTSGTDHLQLWMSGCNLNPVATDIVVEGTSPSAFSWQPQTCGIIIKDAIGDAYSA